MSKPKKSSKSKKSKKTPVDKNLVYCDDKNFDETLAVMRINHCVKCNVYREMAQKIFSQVVQQLPDKKLKLILNEFDKLEPQDGSFEVSIARNCRAPERAIWSGLNRGPPRRDKFPHDLKSLIEEIKMETK